MISRIFNSESLKPLKLLVVIKLRAGKALKEGLKCSYVASITFCGRIHIIHIFAISTSICWSHHICLILRMCDTMACTADHVRSHFQVICEDDEDLSQLSVELLPDFGL